MHYRAAKIEVMMTDDVTRVDMHVKILDETVVRRAKQAGLDALVYAPHFTHLSEVRARAERYTDEELLVVPARECFTGDWQERRHVLVVDPSEPIPDFLSFDATMGLLADRDETVLAPHPEFLTMSLSRGDIRSHRDVFDGVEVFCPKNWSFHTERMQTIAEEVALPAFASSYAHLPWTIGEVWVEFERPIEQSRDLTDAISAGEIARCSRRGGVEHLLKRRAEFCHLFKENTIDKVRRLAFEHPEQTNPNNGRYDDEYRDLSAY
jgi:predicted metal-dependent phosphoesterase TrpH